MKNRKILVASTAILIAALASMAVNVPKAYGFYSSSPTVTLSGLGATSFTDPLFTSNTVDAIGAGSTLTVTVFLMASNTNPSYQRNVTIGFKGDWMTQYQNASNSSPSSTLSLTSSQQATVSISITMPSTGGLTPHTWSVAIWDGPLNSQNGATCAAGNNADRTASCDLISYTDAGYIQLAIYTGDQLAAAQASKQASAAISSVTDALSLIPASVGPRPGATAAAGQIAQANSEMTLGSQSWQNGDYSGARTHYQNALNDANSAASSLTSQGGGSDTAGVVNQVLGGTGILLIGVGALLAGFGAFIRYRRKT